MANERLPERSIFIAMTSWVAGITVVLRGPHKRMKMGQRRVVQRG